MNLRDSEIMRQMLAGIGYATQAATPEHADLVVINTCSVRAKAEQKVYSLLGQLKGNATDSAKQIVAVTGCVAQQEGSTLFQRMPHVNIVLGTQQIYRLADLVLAAEQESSSHTLATGLSSSFVIPAFHKLPFPAVSQQITDEEPRHKRFVNIMQGCNNFCAYCVVPYTRGREISRPLGHILDEAQALVESGVKEITLLGQNVNSYGQTNRVADTPVTFSDLLRQVARISGLQRLRFTTSHPKDLSPELIGCFDELDILCPQFHLPVQSGSNAVLRRMNRGYTREEYLSKVEQLLERRPEMAIATDIIIGFPGETEEDFSLTLDLLRQVRYHSSFFFKYSDRPHTPAATFPDKVEPAVASRRFQEFQELQDHISLERNQEYLGKTVEVLIDQINRKASTANGRTPTNHIVHFPPEPQHNQGDLVQVRITGAGRHSLKGETLP